jgi:hypothetical protein
MLQRLNKIGAASEEAAKQGSVSTRHTKKIRHFRERNTLKLAYSVLIDIRILFEFLRNEAKATTQTRAGS